MLFRSIETSLQAIVRRFGKEVREFAEGTGDMDNDLFEALLVLTTLVHHVEPHFEQEKGQETLENISRERIHHLLPLWSDQQADDETAKLKAYVSKTGLQGHTQNSIHDLSQLEKELELVKSVGHARDDEELEVGVSCMAAAILDDSGKLVAGLSLSAPTERMQEEWLKSLKDTALQISKSLGYKPTATK